MISTSLNTNKTNNSNFVGCVLLLAACLWMGQTRNAAAQATNGPATATNAPAGLGNIKIPSIAAVKEDHLVSISGDYLFGYGTVASPFGFGLANATQNNKISFPPVVGLGKRDSTYWRTTLSYAFNPAWSIDGSYSRGTSSVSNYFPLNQVTSPNLPPGDITTLNDAWYQIYVRYAFPQFRGKPFAVYLRLGATYVDSLLQENATYDVYSYHQHDRMNDFEGNLGGGISYALLSKRKYRLSLSLEGEGFAGHRSQDIHENLENPGFVSQGKDEIGNLLYGVFGRTTLRLEVFPLRKRNLRIFTEGGIQARDTFIEYSSQSFVAPSTADFSSETLHELLWGPYVKVGLKFSF